MKSRTMMATLAALMSLGLYGCAEEGGEFGEQPVQQDTFAQQPPEHELGTQQQPGDMQPEEGGMQQ